MIHAPAQGVRSSQSLKLLLALLVLGSSFLISEKKAHALEITPPIGVVGYPNSLTLSNFSSGEGQHSVYSTTSPTTILAISVFASQALQYNEVSCVGGDNWIMPFTDWPMTGMEPSNNTRYGDLHCTGDIRVNDNGADLGYFIQFVPYDTRGTISEPMTIDWTMPIIVAAWILAFMGFIGAIWATRLDHY